MDANRFDNLVRNLPPAPSRRGVLAALSSGLLAALPFALGGEEIEASKKNRKKKRRKKKHRCKPNCVGKVCGNDGCGSACGSCASDQTCLSNGGCAFACTTSETCGNGCACAVNAEGETYCVPVVLCADLTIKCTTTDDCAAGQHCQSTLCPNGPGLCAPVCDRA